MVYQDFRLIPTLNVYENVAFAMRVVEASQKDIRKRVPMVLSLVGLSHKYKMFPNELSGGEQQRVAIARALVFDPDIIFLDEPIGNLDSKTGKEIMQLFQKINIKYNKTLIQVTHSAKAAKYGTSIIRLVDGQIVEHVDVCDEDIVTVTA